MAHHKNTFTHRLVMIVLSLMILFSLLGQSSGQLAAAQDGPEGDGLYVIDESLLPPSPVWPLEGAVPIFTPTFHWTAVVGIDKYRLEYTSDPSCSFGSGTTSFVETVYPVYTPITAFPNDVNYCWRVRSQKGTSVSPWSDPPRRFVKRWYLQPELLTPPNNYQYVRETLFSWSPVPGAARYKVEVSPENSFPPKYPGWTEYTANPFYNQPDSTDKVQGGDWYWRVTPIDWSNNLGRPSVVRTFHSTQPDSEDYPAPHLASPLYYYQPWVEQLSPQPNELPEPLPEDFYRLSPHEDRSAALPVFSWRRTLVSAWQTEVAAYRVQVDNNEDFSSPVWGADTENLSAVPSGEDGQIFKPAQGEVYFWRVCALDGLGGNCLTDPRPDNDQVLWSEAWKVRFDPAVGLGETFGGAPNLLRPVDRSEAVEGAPLLEWQPLDGAALYEVQISVDPGFAVDKIAERGIALHPAYAPRTHLDANPLDLAINLPYGLYYWRVRGLDDRENPVSPWSGAWRFQIAAQSYWRYARVAGSLANRWQVATDPIDGLDAYELTGLTVSQSSSHWHFGFPVGGVDLSRGYALYIDQDQVDGSGAMVDPQGNAIQTVGSSRPEYVIYLYESDSYPNFRFTASSPVLYQWTGSSWGPAQSLQSLGGDLFPGRLSGMAVSSGVGFFSAGKHGTIWQWDGSGWQLHNTVTGNTLNAIDLDDGANERWAVGDGGVTLYWSYPESIWKEPTYRNTNPNNLYAVDIAASKLVVAAGANGTILRWRGTSWSKDTFENPAFAYDIFDVKMVTPDGNNGWAIGEAGKILRWSQVNYVYQWREVASPTGQNLRSLAMISDSDGWAVGDGGTILHWDGSAWSIAGSPTAVSLHSVAIFSAASGWAVGANGTILRWNGSDWSQVTSPTPHHLYAVDVLSENDAWIGGANGANLHWNGSSWLVGQDPLGGFIELVVPSTAIGMEEETGSIALAMVTVDRNGQAAVDSMPAGQGDMLNHFAVVTERMQPSAPLTNLTGDPTVFPTALPFLWNWPSDVPWEGYRLEVALDNRFTTPVYWEEVTANDSAGPHLAAGLHTPYKDFVGDNTYYWRVRPMYHQPQVTLGGAYSQPWRFERKGFALTKESLNIEVKNGAPTFSWRLVEGAGAYELEVDDDALFGSPDLTTITTQTSYRLVRPLKSTLYYLRVRILRYNRDNPSLPIKSDWMVLPNFKQTFLPVIQK